jgi:CheY-like chemotaxis protein
MARKKYTILIVDDDKKFLTMLTAALHSTYNYLNIETANSGEECLRRVKQNAPNLVFLDVGMKGMNGLVTLRFIKSINEPTLVFFLSGHSEKYLNDAVRMVPADGYFTKTQFLEILKNDLPLETVLNDGKIPLGKK